jgi:hypothetical protein
MAAVHVMGYGLLMTHHNLLLLLLLLLLQLLLLPACVCRDKPRLISDGEKMALLYNIACCHAQLQDARSGLVALSGGPHLGHKQQQQQQPRSGCCTCTC